MHRIEVNVRTGKQTIIPLSDQEIAELQSRPQPEPPPELTPEEKLSRAGLSVNELRQLLGLQTNDSESI